MIKKIGMTLAAAILIASLFLPVQEILTWADYKILPAHAKQTNFIRLRKTSGETVYLLGTVHEQHFQKASRFPYQNLKSALDSISPDVVIVEIRPQSLIQGQWGEGPPEMPYLAALASKSNIPVKGMDYWRADYKSARDMEDRENQMAKLIMESASGFHKALVFTGFSHIDGLKRRLMNQGYSLDSSFSSKEKSFALSQTEPDTIPKIYFEAVSNVILRASQHLSDYSPEWANQRKALLKSLQAKAGR